MIYEENIKIYPSLSKFLQENISSIFFLQKRDNKNLQMSRAPYLVKLLRDAGIGDSEISKMKFQEFQEIVTCVGSKYGSTFEEINEKLKAEDSLQEPQIIIPQVVSSEENAKTAKPFLQSPLRKVKNDSEIVAERHLESVKELNHLRSEMVKILKISESARYTSTVHEQANKCLKDLSSGFLIAVNLHDGTRIQKYFHKEDPLSMVYIWCANNDKLLKDQVRLGYFIIIDIDGNEMDPEKPISSINALDRALLFLRLI